MPQRPIQDAPRSEGGWGMIQTRNAAKPLSFISLIPLWLSHLNRPPPLPTREKGGDESDPPKNRGVALVLIYPCGKAQKQPPGAALKARRRTYEMARGRPLSPGALAPARWPDELENPIRVFAVAGWLVVQGFVLLDWAGWRVFQGLMLLGWAVFRAGQFVVGLPALVLFFFAGVWYVVWSFVRRPFPSLDENPVLALVNYHTPNFFSWLVLWYYLSPFVAVMLSGLIAVTVWKVWLEGRRRDFAPFAKLPPWPLDPKQKAPAIVIGEVHHPVEAREIFSPSWLTIPERGLYTGVAIFGAVGSGKTSACMNPFARQLLGWQAGDPHMRAAALVLEVKGDFCHDIRQILVEAGRGQDYIELGMDARSQWNPLSAWWLDSYSLAYTVSSLLNQLFGKGKEPFWQQAYTNLVRWIIELHRVFPERWVTLQQVYRCAIDPELFAAKIEAAEKLSDDLNTGTVFIKADALAPQVKQLAQWDWTPTPGGQKEQAVYTRPMKAKLDELHIAYEIVWEPGPGEDTRERVEAVKRWFVHDWQTLDNKIKPGFPFWPWHGHSIHPRCPEYHVFPR